MGIVGDVKKLKDKTTLSVDEVAFLKNKFDQIHNWKDAAVAEFTEVNDKLELAKAKLIDHEKRIKALENA